MSEFAVIVREPGAPTPARPSHIAREHAGLERPQLGQARSVAPPLSELAVRESRPPGVQAKLAVSHPSDAAEVEADRMADAVMQMREPEAQRACAGCENEEAARMAEEDEQVAAMAEEDEQVAAMADEDEQVSAMADEDEQVATARSGDGAPEVTADAESQIRGLSGGGAPLPAPARAYFEPRFGADFSGVRVHTGPEASSLARSLSARAFTVGRDIAFADGLYAPSSQPGKRLLAHELTHVIQQGGADKR